MRFSSAPPRVMRAAVMVALLAGTCNLSCFDDDCALTSTCPGDNCPGQCVPLPPIGFDTPALLWFGPETELPECPTDAPARVYLGYGDVDDSGQCPSCQCTAPTCMVPSSVTASTLTCPGGGTTTEYTMPESWTGECAPIAPAPPAPLESLTIAPVTVRPCEPSGFEVPASGAPRFPPPLIARACKGEVVDTVCNDPSLTCVPSAKPPPPGFRQCVAWLRDGEPTCPAEYPEPLTFYDDIQDARSCSPCECTEASPSNCLAEVRFYQSSSCTAFSQSENVGSSERCTIPIGGSMPEGIEAEMLVDDPGSCVASGGDQTGQVVRTKPTTFCCQPLP